MSLYKTGSMDSATKLYGRFLHDQQVISVTISIVNEYRFSFDAMKDAMIEGTRQYLRGKYAMRGKSLIIY